jgi:tRNA A37 threonylcarbamoyladenosine dehydratase
MTKNWKERTQLMLGEEGVAILENSHVLIVGLGGVGSYAAEAIARAGVGTLTIVDGDVVDPTNRNRQLQALSTTHGLSKALLMQERIQAINPDVRLHVIKEFIDPEPMVELLKNKYDYVIDAIDSITPKMHLIKTAYEQGHHIVSSMGAGGKMDPTQIYVAPIMKTHTCPLAHLVRKRLRYEKMKDRVKAVFSTELPDRESIMHTDGTNFKKSAYGTISTIPAAFGLTCASVVLRDLIGWQELKGHENPRASKRNNS